MPIFQTGKAPVAMRWIDPSGHEHHIVAAYLGEHLVWDGTVPASETVPRMQGTGVSFEPDVLAAALVQVPAMLGAGEVLAPVPGGGGGIFAPPMVGEAGLLEPAINGSATIRPGSMDGSGELHEPGVGTEVPGLVIVPTAIGSGSFPAPTVHVPATIEAPVMDGAGAVPEAQVNAGATLEVPVASGSGDGLAPEVTAAAVAQAPVAEGSGTIPVPTHAAGHSVEVPVMEGSGEMPVPDVEAANLVPAGILKSGTQSLTSSNAWHQVTGWVVDSAYPETTLSSNAIVVDGSGSAVLSAAVAWSTANGNRQCRIKVNGTVVATSTATTGTPTINAFETTLEPGDLVTLEAYTTTGFTAYRTIAVSGTFLRLAAVVPLVLRGSDTFDGTGPLSSDWVGFGGGTLKRTDGLLDGTGTPSTPLSYIYWAAPMPSTTQVVRAEVQWAGRNPEHSSCALVVRANPYQDPVTNPGAQWGVQFGYTRGYMSLLYEDYDASAGGISGAVFATGTGLETISKFPDGTVLELRAEGELYTVRANGVIIMQGTVPNSAIPITNPYCGLMIQDDSAVSGGGTIPGFLDNFEVLTP